MSSPDLLIEAFSYDDPCTPADGVVFAGLLIAEAPPRPGLGAFVTAVTSAAFDAGFDVPTAAVFVRRLRALYVSLVDDENIDSAQLSEKFGLEFVDALSSLLPPGADTDEVLQRVLPRYTLILEAFACSEHSSRSTGDLLRR